MTWLASLWLCPIVVLKRYCADLCLHARNPCLPCLAELGFISLIKWPRTQDSLPSPIDLAVAIIRVVGTRHRVRKRKDVGSEWYCCMSCCRASHDPAAQHASTPTQATVCQPNQPTRYQAPSGQSAWHELPNYCTCVRRHVACVPRIGAGVNYFAQLAFPCPLPMPPSPAHLAC